MKKLIARILKFLLLGIVLLGIGFGILFYVLNKPLPSGKSGPEAEALAQRMLKAVNKEAWDKTRYVAWTFHGSGEHHYVWDKEKKWVRVSWGKNYMALLNISTQDGYAYKDGTAVSNNEQKKLLKKAYKYFINDSFWLNAPVQVINPDTERKIVITEKKDTALLVTYNSGGVTPGDSYLWYFDDVGRPKKWRIWASILPIGGVEFTWEEWEMVNKDVHISTMHKGNLLNVKISNLKAGNKISRLGLNVDPFAGIE